jgi:hypothetical protein
VVKDKVTKVELQMRYMLFILREAFGVFQTIHPTYKLGFSKFCDLRPFYVKKLAETPHNVCVCVYHGNTLLLVKVVQKVCPEFPTAVASAFVFDDGSSAFML